MVCNCSGCPDEDMALIETVIVEASDGVMTGGGVTVMLAVPQPAA